MRITNEQIVEMFKQGNTYTEIAKTVGVSRQRICQIIKRHYPEYKRAKAETFKCSSCKEKYIQIKKNYYTKVRLCTKCKLYNYYIKNNPVKERRIRRFKMAKACIVCGTKFTSEIYKAKNMCNRDYRRIRYNSNPEFKAKTLAYQKAYRDRNLI